MRVSIYTLGCKVNQYETNSMKQKFINHGYEIVEFSEKADIYVINTCTVTNIADKKSRQMLRRAKEKNQNALVVACGCYAQVAKSELEQIDEIDLIIGNEEKKDIVEYIEDCLSQKIKKKNNVTDIGKKKEFLDFEEVSSSENSRAEIKIQDGCNQFCTYCIIPYARGRVRSRKKESIIKEITILGNKGVKEVVITGIHIASYGKDLEDITLIELLEEINKITTIQRIRLGSLEPTIVTETFVTRLNKLNKICDQFHLSLQSGCNKVLEKMNRKYTKEQFEKATNLLKMAFPNVAITTDIIVGFPGETVEDFNETYQFLKEIAFLKMHIFKYSPRKGTLAAKMEGQIDNKEKEKRSKALIELSNQLEAQFLSKYIGKEVEVLFEERQGEYMKGHTTNYMLVKTKTNKDLENVIKKVKIKEVKNLELNSL